MRDRIRIIGSLSLAGLLAFAFAGGQEDASLSDISTSETRGLAGVQAGNVVLEPTLETLTSLRADEGSIYVNAHGASSIPDFPGILMSLKIASKSVSRA